MTSILILIFLIKYNFGNYDSKQIVRKSENLKVQKWNFESIKRQLGVNTTLRIGDMFKQELNDSESSLCPNKGRGIKIFVAFISAPTNFQQREEIRKLWWKFKNPKFAAMAFFMGKTDNQETQKLVDKEISIFGDVHQTEFVDVYLNLTIKVASMLQFMYKKCQHVKFVAKVDDDVFLNGPLLDDFLNSNIDVNKTIFGYEGSKNQFPKPKDKKY